MTPTNSLGLDKLQPERKPNKTSRFSEDEWAQIKAGRERGLAWRQIHETTGKRYKNEGALANAFQAWKKGATARQS